MKGLTIRRIVTGLDWDANHWELFAGMEGAEMAARDLNRTFIHAVNADFSDRRSVQAAMGERMRHYAKLGATDSEPLYHLETLLDAIFPEKD